MLKILRKPLRFALKVSIESFVVTWFMKNRGAIIEKLRKNDDKTDPTRPIGDRAVPIVADRPPSPFEAAMAESAPPITPAIEAHLQDAASHVRIDPSNSVSSNGGNA